MARSAHHVRRTAKSNPRGVLQVHPAGYGFVLTAEGEFFIAERHMKGAFDGDLVEVAPFKISDDRRTKNEDRLEATHHNAKVVQVLSRAHETIVGRLEVAEPFAIVIPADPHITHDIFTLRAEAPDVPDGAIVRVTMVTYPDRNSAATGVIDAVLATDAQTAAVDLILGRYHLDAEFSPETLSAAENAVDHMDVAHCLANGYRDLRDRVIFTIDPDDAKDYDDAISFEVLPDGTRRVGVHIADVSAFVPWDGPVDAEAKRRATSVYAVDRVLPMLPEALSNGLCSLVAGEDRLTMTVDMVLTANGQIASADLYPAVIRSAARLTYGQAQQVIDGADHDVPEAVAQRILQLNQVAAQRRRLAEGRGCLNFDSPEAKVKLDAKGVPTDIILRTKTDATSLIEECMILANVAVAHFLVERQQPGAFRVHERPDADALATLIPVLGRFPWFAKVDHELFAYGDPSTLRRTLALAEERGQGALVSNLMLRSMKRAVYKPTCDGHYGLALEEYCHFTSPIRRYPDLIVHRMAKAALGFPQPAFGAQTGALPFLCQHSSQMERVAEEAARETQVYKIIEYLQRFVGQQFLGVISGVCAHCLYVRLENTAEGTIEVTDLTREYYAYDPKTQCLVGESTGHRYSLGDPIAVSLVEADPKTRTLRFKEVRR